VKNLDVKKIADTVNAANNYIDTVLTMENDDLPVLLNQTLKLNHTKWQRVEDGLPEIGEVVLVCFKTARDHSLLRSLAYRASRIGGYCWCTDVIYEEPGLDIADDIQVTHWRPLPGLPTTA